MRFINTFKNKLNGFKYGRCYGDNFTDSEKSYSLILDRTKKEFEKFIKLAQLKKQFSTYIFWYPSAFLASGLMYNDLTHKKGTHTGLLTRFYDQFIDINGDFYNSATISIIDNVIHGPLLLYLFKITNNLKFKRACQKIYSFIQSAAVTDNGIFVYRKSIPQLVLVDTLGMICPFLSEFAITFNDKNAAELAIKHIKDYLQFGMDQFSHLPFHGHISGSPVKIGICGWGRGTGWLLIGVVPAILQLKESFSNEINPFIEKLVQIADKLKLFQRTEGAWGWAITNPYSQLESSGTAMISSMLLLAIKNGILPESYKDVTNKAEKWILSTTTKKGYVLGCSDDCFDGPGFYPSKFSNFPWGQGAATILLSLNNKKSQY